MRPAPLVTDDSAVFWESASEHRLVAQRCLTCTRLRHPPRPMCPFCHSLEFEVTDLSGQGTLYSFAILHHPQHRAFEYPVLAALVDLDEGLRMVSNLVEVEPADIAIGMKLSVVFTPVEGGGAIPLFGPVE